MTFVYHKYTVCFKPVKDKLVFSSLFDLNRLANSFVLIAWAKQMKVKVYF
jgi:hypothetical protein